MRYGRSFITLFTFITYYIIKTMNCLKEEEVLMELLNESLKTSPQILTLDFNFHIQIPIVFNIISYNAPVGRVSDYFGDGKEDRYAS